MALIKVDIEDYIDEIDDYYLIKELKRRADNGNKNAKKTYKESVIDFIENKDDKITLWPEIKTIADQQKREWVNENWDNIKI